MDLKEKINILVLMGVSGVGKTYLGQKISDFYNVPFYDGDDFHPKANVEKMSSGHPLDDEDRWPWLEDLNQHMQKQTTSCVYACSALKEKYRSILSKNIESKIKFIFLNGSPGFIKDRLSNRKNHFMPPGLLKSQFDTLEIPENAIEIDVSQNEEEILKMLHRFFN
ncbi:MAG: gluconokinase [Bacteroidia bacterium]|nr:gluconokinase [Bacteroidia bacterium]